MPVPGRRGRRAREGTPARIRIIGGTWRGRRIPVPEQGVRPTPDRVRETLFNWLAPVIPGARVLDLFAGSGAVGLEALSRGAARSVFVEQDPRAAAALRGVIEMLGAADRAEVHTRGAEAFLSGTPEPYDLIALDPPFRSHLVPVCARLLARGWLVAGGRIYVETDTAEPAAEVPAAWELLRETTAGAVRARLYGVGSSEIPDAGGDGQ